MYLLTIEKATIIEVIIVLLNIVMSFVQVQHFEYIFKKFI